MPLRCNRWQYEQLTDFDNFNRPQKIGRIDVQPPPRSDISCSVLATVDHRRHVDIWIFADLGQLNNWRRVIFSDESRFIRADDHRTRVWRRTGQRSDPAFIVRHKFHKLLQSNDNGSCRKEPGDLSFPPSVFFTDEVPLSRQDVFKAFNSPVWAYDNPHGTRSSVAQHHFAVNVCAGIIDDHSLESSLLLPPLKRRKYLIFLETDFSERCSCAYLPRYVIST
ncbi:hypothetical protein TNCV_1312611 [Trichonephila clavipes]|nr:hypothetical protein TNCV_1312611 [Trichonephila clavipes]